MRDFNESDRSTLTSELYVFVQLVSYGQGKFSTGGKDGNVILWDGKSLESSIAGLRIA